MMLPTPFARSCALFSLAAVSAVAFAADDTWTDFSGAALATMQSKAKPAGDTVLAAVRRIAKGESIKQQQSFHDEGAQAFEIDLDGDGKREGLGFYTLEGTPDGGNYTARSGVVLRETGFGWQPVLEFPIGTNMVGFGTVSAIDGRRITVTIPADVLDKPQVETYTVPK